VALALPLALAASAPAVAQSPSPGASPTPVPLPPVLTVTTTYPSLTVNPGDEAVFPMSVSAPTQQRVDLSVTSIPEGFGTQFRGAGGVIVNSVTTTLDVPPELEFAVQVPDAAAPGSYPVTVTATSEDGGSVDLPVTVVTADVSGGQLNLTTDVPGLEGDTSGTFTFNLTLTNDTSQQLTIVLEGVGPEGWDVNARPSGQTQAASVVVDAGDTQRIQVVADPPVFAPAGDYPIAVRASGGGYSVEQALLVRLTGSYDMTLTTPDGRLNTNATAGSTTTFSVLVQNTGSAPLEAVAINATPPSGWQVTFDQETVDVPVDSQVTVTASITPSGNAVAGDYNITIRASNAKVNESMTLRTTVEVSSLWWAVGIGLIVIVLVGLFLVFRRFGRR
jgi:uncharacterized repeat protein (TIGR01451 family)